MAPRKSHRPAPDHGSRSPLERTTDSLVLFDAPLDRGADAASMQTQLHRRIKSAILDGRLPPGCRMPGTRALAEQLAVSRNTVTAAYDHLAAEGYIEADRQGTRVAALIAPNKSNPPHATATPSALARRVQEIASAAPSALTAQRVPAPTRSPTPPALAKHNEVPRRAGLAQAYGPAAESSFAFRPGTPALSHFPLAAWRRALDRAIRAGGVAALAYGDPMGEAALRRAIAAHLAVTRGVRCTAAQIVVTDGAQAALDLCIGLLTNPGDTAWVEDPGYRGAKAAMRAGDLRVVPIRVDAQGLAASSDDWDRAPPRVVYTSPSHQYPTGAVMSAARRLALIDAARHRGAWIIEDDYDSEFRYASEPIGAMQGLVDDAPVLYVGSFSKTMFPSLRLGFVVLPHAVAERVPHVLAERLRGGSRHAQLAMADFIDSGQFSRHLGRMRRLYRGRQAALRAALAADFAVPHEIAGGGAGMHLTVRLQETCDDRAIAAAARAHGMAPSALSMFAIAPLPVDNGLVLGYGNTAEERFGPLVRCLSSLVQSLPPAAAAVASVSPLGRDIEEDSHN